MMVIQTMSPIYIYRRRRICRSRSEFCDARMEEAAELAELERVQTGTLHPTSKLEAAIHVNNDGTRPHELPTTASATTEDRLSAILRSNGVSDFAFKRVASDYYDWPYESRRDVLGAASIDHLCKSIVLVNTRAPSDVIDCTDRNNSKYYIVVVQYTARFNAESVRSYLYALNEGKVAKKKFNLRLAPEETSFELTGYGHNAVTCVGMKTDIPVILDEAIVKLAPDFIWLGGGEVDLKLGIRTSEFVNAVKPFIFSCSGSS